MSNPKHPLDAVVAQNGKMTPGLSATLTLGLFQGCPVIQEESQSDKVQHVSEGHFASNCRSLGKTNTSVADTSKETPTAASPPYRLPVLTLIAPIA